MSRMKATCPCCLHTPIALPPLPFLGPDTNNTTRCSRPERHQPCSPCPPPLLPLPAPRMISPVLLPETVTLICTYLDTPELAVVARVNRTWSEISLPLLYREIVLAWRGFKIDSLELGVLRNGHFCQRFKAAREVNHWCTRIVALLRCMPNLTNLDATWMNADLLESLVHLQKLERLSISRLQGSQSEDNEFFEPSFQGSKRIKELNMADSSQMTDSALVSITRTCQQIRVLIVSGNRCLTHEGLIQWCDQLFSPPLLPKTPAGEISDFVPMTELTTINFANCSRIQSIGFQALFERSRHLQHVNLMSTRVGDEALQVLAAKNQGLRTVVLNCCVAISDAGLQTLLRDCRKLRAVSFLYCNRITVRVFFQNLWRCLGLKELRFSLNGWHVDLIERGIEGPTPEVEVNPSVILQHEDGFQGITAPQSHYYEPHLEFMIFGKPELDDTTDHHTLTQGLEPEDSFSSMQEYRQRLILSRMYGQIERLCQLEILDMRNTHLPFDLASGLCRLGRLEKLQILEWTGLEQPLGPPEITWLTGTVNKAAPLPSLHQLVFKGGYSMSKELLRKLKDHRPNLEVQLTQLLDHS